MLSEAVKCPKTQVIQRTDTGRPVGRLATRSMPSVITGKPNRHVLSRDTRGVLEHVIGFQVMYSF